jgi:hypothetical protein
LARKKIGARAKFSRKISILLAKKMSRARNFHTSREKNCRAHEILVLRALRFGSAATAAAFAFVQKGGDLESI